MASEMRVRMVFDDRGPVLDRGQAVVIECADAFGGWFDDAHLRSMGTALMLRLGADTFTADVDAQSVRLERRSS